MERRSVLVSCQSGLLHKQAVHFVQKANEFQSDLWVEFGSRKLNAKSLLGIMYMGLVPGTRPTLCADGPDAADALDSLEHVMKHDII